MIITSIIVTWIPCSREISPWVSFYRLCPATPIVGELEALSRLPPASPTSGERFKQTDSNRLSFGRPCGVQTILSLPLCLVEGGARAHTHTHTHKHTGRDEFWFQGSIFWSWPHFDVFRRRRINPKHLGIWAVWLWFCAPWLSLSHESACGFQL